MKMQWPIIMASCWLRLLLCSHSGALFCEFSAQQQQRTAILSPWLGHAAAAARCYHYTTPLYSSVIIFVLAVPDAFAAKVREKN